MPETPKTPQSQPAKDDEDLFTYNTILNHRSRKTRKKGSQWEVLVQWDHYPPTYVQIKTFTENGKNKEAWNSVAEYAHKKPELLKLAAWKEYAVFGEGFDLHVRGWIVVPLYEYLSL